MTTATTTPPVFDRFSIWGTSVALGVTSPSALGAARRHLDAVLSATEVAASRFTGRSEIDRLNNTAGSGPLQVSATLFDLVSTALDAYDATDGACDPTVADSLVALGYDRDFDAIDPTPGLELRQVAPSPGIAGISLDAAASTISVPHGVHLDLGATAKARAADVAAELIASTLDVGVLVDLGGDLRASGPAPVGGWQIGVADSARSGERSGIQEVISIEEGAVASSSSGVRTWTRSGRSLHHLIDPATGWPAVTPWRMVTVAAATCVAANAAATASIVWGENALFELPQRSFVARLVRHDGSVERTGGWPRPLEADGGLS